LFGSKSMSSYKEIFCESARIHKGYCLGCIDLDCPASGTGIQSGELPDTEAGHGAIFTHDPALCWSSCGHDSSSRADSSADCQFTAARGSVSGKASAIK